MGVIMKERRIPREEDIEELKEELPTLRRPTANTTAAVSAVPAFEVVEVATQTDMLIQNSKTGEKFNALQMLALIKNDLEEIKKSL
jgi:hypothetical protein